MLAPFAGWARPPFGPLKLIPLGLTAAACFLLWELLRPWLEPRPRFLVLLMFAFNPLVAEYAGRVMSEPLFTAVALASLVLLRRLLREGRGPEAWLLGLLLGWASVIRGEGVALWAAAGLGLWSGGRRRLIVPVLGSASLLGGAVYLGNFLSHHTPTRYLDIWLDAFSRVSWTGHAARMATSVVWTGLLGAPSFPEGAAASAGAACLAAGTAGLFAVGLGRLEARVCAEERPVLRAAYGFFFLYGLIHLFWPVSDPRFLIAVLPLLLAAFAAAGRGGLHKPVSITLRIALLALLLSYLGVNALALRGVLSRPPRDRAPARTLSWLSRETPPSARIWGFYDSSMIQLYAGRKGVFLGIPPEEESFRYHLLQEGVDYLFYSPPRCALEPLSGAEDLASVWARSRAWVESSPEAYLPVHAEPLESTAVFRVLPSEGFQEAYRLYRSALDELSLQRWERGSELLEESLRREPRLVGALNAYGATCLITGRRLDLGERRLREALRLRPGNALARENLERLLRLKKSAGLSAAPAQQAGPGGPPHGGP